MSKLPTYNPQAHTGKQLNQQEIEQAMKDGIKHAYSQGSNPCITKVETCLKMAIVLALSRK